MSEAPLVHRVGRWLLALPLAAWLGLGFFATLRSLSAPRVTLALLDSGSGVEVRVDAPARVETYVDLQVVDAGRVRDLGERVIARSRFAFWNPLWKHARIRLQRRELGALAPGARLRASVQPGMVWLWQQAPVVREIRLD